MGDRSSRVYLRPTIASRRLRGKHVTIKVNDKVAVEWDQPPDWKAGADFKRVLDKGTFALQAHDPKSVIRYRNIRVKRLK